jgi:hypothetical protein
VEKAESHLWADELDIVALHGLHLSNLFLVLLLRKPPAKAEGQSRGEREEAKRIKGEKQREREREREKEEAATSPHLLVLGVADLLGVLGQQLTEVLVLHRAAKGFQLLPP